MPYRALLVTLCTVAIALLAVGMWARSAGPMLAEVNASTQPSESHPAAPVYNPASTAPVPPDKEFKRVMKGTMILAFVLICLLFVVGFFASFREWIRYATLSPDRKSRKTPFVDAWKLAGERLQATPPPDPNDDEENPKDPLA